MELGSRLSIYSSDKPKKGASVSGLFHLSQACNVAYDLTRSPRLRHSTADIEGSSAASVFGGGGGGGGGFRSVSVPLRVDIHQG